MPSRSAYRPSRRRAPCLFRHFCELYSKPTRSGRRAHTQCIRLATQPACLPSPPDRRPAATPSLWHPLGGSSLNPTVLTSFAPLLSLRSLSFARSGFLDRHTSPCTLYLCVHLDNSRRPTNRPCGASHRGILRGLSRLSEPRCTPALYSPPLPATTP